MRAKHQEWYFLDPDNDNGQEGQCLGANYGPPTYSMMKNRDIYSRDRFEPFNPENPEYKSPALEKWVEKQKDNK